MFMIKSEDQRQKTLKRIEGIETQTRKIQSERGEEKSEVFTKVLRRHLEEFKEQVRAYDELKKKGLEPLRPKHLSEVGPYLVRARIASEMTQSDLAEKLSVSQPMVHKYENSEYQNASAGLLSKVARLLDVSLNLETFRTPGSKGYDAKRQEAAIQFFAEQVNNTYLGKTKLMKLLYYSDYEWIQKKGVSITGDSYVAMLFGPVPKHWEETLKRLEKTGAVKIERVKLGQYGQERCIGIKSPDLSIFASEEVEHLHNIARRFESWTAKQMSDLTHEDWPWQSTPLRQEIVFYRFREDRV